MSSRGHVPGDIASLAGTLAGFLLAAGPAHVVERVQLVGAGLVAVEVAYQTADRGRLAAGPAWSDSGYVFTTEVGEPLRPATVSLAFERAVGRAKLPAIRLHDLRHVSATLALLAGVPVHVVSARLGHADPAITLRVYSHCLPTSQRDAAARIGAQIYGSWVVLSAESLPPRDQTGHSARGSERYSPAFTGHSALRPSSHALDFRSRLTTEPVTLGVTASGRPITKITNKNAAERTGKTTSARLRQFHRATAGARR